MWCMIQFNHFGEVKVGLKVGGEGEEGREEMGEGGRRGRTDALSRARRTRKRWVDG